MPDTPERAGFFDRFPRFYETGNTGADSPRLNARYEALIDQNRGHINGATVLDIASHDGRWTFAAIDAGARKVIGVEPRAELVESARASFTEYGVQPERFEFHNADALTFLREQRPKVDTVFVFGAFYHIYYHVELMREIWNTGARTIIIDTEIIQDGGAHPQKSTVEFYHENTDDISQAAYETVPGTGQGIVGRPSRPFVQFVLHAFGFTPTEIPWAPRLDRWGTAGMDDYAVDQRATFVGVRVEDAARTHHVL